MNEYVKQAKDFLKSCNATMKITQIGYKANKNWNENIYRATIKTPLGTMWVKFWDSAYNTEKGIEPTEYDILACLEKYDVGTFEDFVDEFGYESDNLRCAKRIYKVVTREYNDICRCFTPEQIEAMREIQ